MSYKIGKGRRVTATSGFIDMTAERIDKEKRGPHSPKEYGAREEYIITLFNDYKTMFPLLGNEDAIKLVERRMNKKPKGESGNNYYGFSEIDRICLTQYIKERERTKNKKVVK